MKGKMSGYNKEMLNPFDFIEHISLKPLVATDIHKEYGGRVILKKESVSINPGDKIGLVGVNGVGKSTLIKILAGVEQPDNGKVLSENVLIGYLAQDFTLDTNKTIYEIATEGIQPIVEAHREFENKSQNYDASDPEFIKKYNYLLDFLQNNNAFDLPEKVAMIIERFGIKRDLDVKVATLSGGQIMRLALAQILISKADVLLLDEPTNHLDLHANLWLRDFLSRWPGGLLVVSHDRNLLNEVTNNTWELENSEIRQYGGNYDFFKEQKGLQDAAKEREIIRLESEVKRVKRQLKKEIRRAVHGARHDISRDAKDSDKFRAGFLKGKAEKATGKKKAMYQQEEEKLIGNIEKMRKKEVPKISIDIKEKRSHEGKLLISAKDVSFSYGDNTVLENVNINIYSGDRIALFGNNGEGKTTLATGLLGDERVNRKGDMKVNQDINIQFLDQRYASVDRNKSVLENIKVAAPNKSEDELRQHLAKYLFRETEEVRKPASVLSGGETARLVLAITALKPIDILVLDEPTNNLDIDSIEKIEEVIRDFKGTIFVISHDLSFLKNIKVSKSFFIKDKKVKPLKTTPEDGEVFEKEISRLF